MSEENKPKLKLVGQDGNAFMILERAKWAATNAKWSPEKWKEFHDKATSGDYDNLLGTACDYFEVS